MTNPIAGLPLVIDVSVYQGGYSKSKGWFTYLDFPALKAAGVSACIIRLDYGANTDDLFRVHRDAAKAAGLLIGYYAFPTRPYANNLSFLANKYASVANLQRYDGILTASDWETSGSDTMSLSLMEQWQTKLSGRICRPVLTYTSAGEVEQIARGVSKSILGQTYLWTAAYGLWQQPPLPPFWDRKDCALWQFRGGGRFDTWPVSPALEALYSKKDFDISAFLLGDEQALKVWWAEMSGTPVEKF